MNIKMAKEQRIEAPVGGWKRNTHYLVDVCYRKENMIHRAIFYSGYINGGEKFDQPGDYNRFMRYNYGDKYGFEDVFYLKVVKELEINLDD